MTPLPGRPFLHLTVDAHTQRMIEETLRRLGLAGIVIGMRESLTAGPLRDVDSGAASRAEWWTRLYGDEVPGLPAFDDSDLWARVRSAPEDVVLWHGPDPGERVFALRACCKLRDQAERVHEVVMPVRTSTRFPAFFGAVGIAGPERATKEWLRLARVQDVAARAKRWEELRDQPGEWTRELRDDEIVQLPVTAYDDDLVTACSGAEWTRSRLVVARVLATTTPYALLVWRVRELLRVGALEGRGEKNDIGLPEEVRPGSAPVLSR